MARPRKEQFPEGVAAVKEEFVKLRAEGWSYLDIAEKLGVSRQCLQNWSKDLSVEIENAKAFKADSIRAKYRMLQIQKVENFCDLLERIRTEIESRDLSEVPTDKLLDFFLRFTKEARSELFEQRFTDRTLPLEAISTMDEEWTKTRAMP